ncbi:MAG: GNAT family N-acetyltransferase [bacterium]|nr:GNAT family N-acetyltransferase [bacterium]
MPLALLKNPADGALAPLLKKSRPLSLRFEGAIFENERGVPIWADDPRSPRLALHQGKGWLAPIGEKDRLITHLDEIEAICAGLTDPGDEPLIKLSALSLAFRDEIAAIRPVRRETRCGLYTLAETDFRPFQEGPIVETLQEADSSLLAEHDLYGATPAYCARRIRSAPSAAVRIEGELAAYMIVHDNGSIGMLHTLEPFRNRSLARRVVSALVERQWARGRAVYCYIVDGNVSSQKVFTSLGFRRAAEVCWTVFEKEAG